MVLCPGKALEAIIGNDLTTKKKNSDQNKTTTRGPYLYFLPGLSTRDLCSTGQRPFYSHCCRHKHRLLW